MRERGFWALRGLLTTWTAVVAGLAVVVAICLIALSSQIHREATLLVDSLQSVRLGKAIDGLIAAHHRNEDPQARTRAELQLRAAIREAAGFVANEEERRVLEHTDELVMGYLRAISNQEDAHAELERASNAVATLVDLNVAQASDIHARIGRWNVVANVLGGFAIALLALGATGTLVWVRRVAFRPIASIHDAMSRFARGETWARAPATGPQELRDIAAGFNRLAAALVDRQHRQLAFLAGVAHDLRNPLAAMSLTVQRLQRQGEPAPETVTKVGDLLSRQLGRLERMVTDLLDASRIEAGELELRLDTGDLRDLVRETQELFAAVSTRHEVRVELPREPIEVRCDKTRLTQVLANLVSNAIKYSPEAGPIELSVRDEAANAVLSVTDHGQGIAEEDHGRIFEPFRRAHNLRSDVPGCGLGLFVAKRIVEAHGGRIEVDSQVGRGSTFRVRLPLPEASPRA